MGTDFAPSVYILFVINMKGNFTLTVDKPLSSSSLHFFAARFFFLLARFLAAALRFVSSSAAISAHSLWAFLVQQHVNKAQYFNLVRNENKVSYEPIPITEIVMISQSIT